MNAKTCARCQQPFEKRKKCSARQWAEQIFCSQKCARVKPIPDRLLSFSTMRESGCREWTGEFNVCGYGRLSVTRDGHKKQILAHRLFYETFVGPIPVGKMVLHSCDNPKCVRLEHLRIGTNAENMAEKVAKGRQARPTRDKNGNAKLNSAALRVIVDSRLPRDVLAEAFSVTVETIYFARREALTKLEAGK